MTTAAVTAVVLLAVVAVFQLALAAGVPVGHAAWGGRHHGILPDRLRAASAIAGLVIYPLAIAYVLVSSGIAGTASLPGSGPAAMWVLVGFFGLGAVANLASPSRLEKVWAPVSLIIAIGCAIVALSI